MLIVLYMITTEQDKGQFLCDSLSSQLHHELSFLGRCTTAIRHGDSGKTPYLQSSDETRYILTHAKQPTTKCNILHAYNIHNYSHIIFNKI